MLELALALVGLVTAGIISLIGHAITSQAAVVVGLVAIALGLAVGLTTGFWYHVMLYRSSRPGCACPAGGGCLRRACTRT